MNITVSDYIAQYLEEQLVPCVYELVGGMITQLIDSIHRRGATRIVSMHHEQAAAFAADTTGRILGIPGVALATSGPGAVNLLTGIGSCYFDSSPAVFITGQVNRNELRGERAIRQLGFQETDIVSMARPITKGAWLVERAEQIPQLLDQAFDLAVRGRPGPVLLDIPMDVQRGNITQPHVPSERGAGEPGRMELGRLFEDLARAQRPLVLAGGGVRASRSSEAFAKFVERLGVPVVHSLMGVDLLPCEHRLRVGMIGTYGNRWANIALSRADFLLVVGSRLDVRQTGADTASFKGDKTIYHVDVAEGEVNNRIAGCHAIIAELDAFIHSAIAQSEAVSPRCQTWLQEINALRVQWPDVDEQASTPGINPNICMHAISRACADAGAYVVDVGQHQMWAAQSLELRSSQRFLTSGGMGSMGFALPGAIGASIASGMPTVVICGDGGIQCNIQELQTVVRNRLPIRIVVLDNGCLGMVRQFQECYFDARYPSTLWGYSAPDFVRVAEAYGIDARCVERSEDVDGASRWLGQTSGPTLLHVKIAQNANAYPKIAFGRPISDMEPFERPIDFEST